MNEIAAQQPPPAPEPTSSRGLTSTRWVMPLVIVCALAALFWPRSDFEKAPLGTVENFDGESIALERELAPVTLLHFWATWCAPCRLELPKLKNFEKDLVARPDFRVLMVAVSDDRRKAVEFLGAGPEKLLFDPEWKVAKRYGTDKLPETYLIVDGALRHRFVGATDWDDPEVRRRVLDARTAGKPIELKNVGSSPPAPSR
jgi:thiol-disulfide isomerase/thioredoxin